MTARKLFMINSLAWSPDGHSLAISGFGKTVRILDASTLVTRRVYVSHRPRLGICCCWSPDGQRVASVGSDDHIHVWHVGTANRLLSLPMRYSRTVAYSPNGTLLAAASCHGDLSVWHAGDGCRLASFQLPQVAWNTCIHGCRLAWSPTGEQIAWATRYDVYVWSSFTGKLEFTLHSTAFTYPHSLAWSPDGDRLAVVGMSARIGTHSCVDIWNPKDERIVLTYPALDPREEFVQVAWSPDGQLIACSGIRPVIHVWQPDTGEQIAEYAGHRTLVTALSWSPDSTSIASGDQGGFVRIWRPDTGLAYSSPAVPLAMDTN